MAVLTGDAGLMMCLSELATAVRLGCRLVVVAMNDAALMKKGGLFARMRRLQNLGEIRR